MKVMIGTLRVLIRQKSSAAPQALSSTVGNVFGGQDTTRTFETLGTEQNVQEYVDKVVELTQPEKVHWCTGAKEEEKLLLKTLQDQGMIKTLKKYENCYLVRTDPADVARVESRTIIGTDDKHESIPQPLEGVKGQLGHWMPTEQLQNTLQQRFTSCMKGRTAYVIPFSMGPLDSPLAKFGVQVTDSAYVALSMRVMTRVTDKVYERILEGGGGVKDDFVRCVHSVGRPLPMHEAPVQNWPCNPEETIISHLPHQNTIASFGSGYGGNSLLGKKCLALRLGSILGRKEGWLAEHMLIIGVTGPSGKKRYIAAAFPSACGKTNLAMMLPTLPGYKIECVGDDIAWMRFDSQGQLRAINPENGFFGVAPGTSMKTNPIAMKTIEKNTIFTNTAETTDGGFYWEGMESEAAADAKIIDWQGQPWSPDSGRPSAHPNSRFCTPAEQLPTLDEGYYSPEGVPIDAILFGGRRPEGVPLVCESFDWDHGVFYGAAMRSEATAAAEHKTKQIMHDPFAMRPFFGYNFGHYLQHWLDLPQKTQNAKAPKIFAVNWFRKADRGGFLWPGFGENCRVLDWVLRRVEGDEGRQIATRTPIGYIPKKDAFRLDGLKETVDWDQLFSISKQFWQKEALVIDRYLHEQLGKDVPAKIQQQSENLQKRLKDYQE